MSLFFTVNPVLPVAVSVGATGVARGVVSDAVTVCAAPDVGVAVSVTVYNVLEEVPVTAAVFPLNGALVNPTEGDTV